MPILNETIDYHKFIQSHSSLDVPHFIAHCDSEIESFPLSEMPKKQGCTILIGPEGDFTSEEINLARQTGYQPVNLGQYTLRTETAGIIACYTALYS